MDLCNINGKITKIEYFSLQYGGQQNVYAFVRNGEKREMLKLNNVPLPYFYVPEDAEISEQIKKFIHSTEEGYNDIFGNKLKKLKFEKIYGNGNNYGLYEIRSFFSKTFEDDIKYTDRVTIDMGINFSQVQRILYIDIETDYCLDRTAPKPIIIVTAYDSFIKKYIVWIWRNDFSRVDKDVDEEKTIKFFSTEKEMLLDFLEFYEKNYPDIVTGWNFMNYDAPYIINRMKNIGIDHRRLSQAHIVTCKQNPNYNSNMRYGNEWFIKVCGHEWVDMKNFAQNILQHDFPRPNSYALKEIGEFLFGENGEGKLVLKKRIDEMWKDNNITVLNELLDYSFRDVELLVKINEKRGIFDYYIMLQQKIPTELSNCVYPARLIDVYILRKYHKIYCFPSTRNRQRTELLGGHVEEPIKGFYKNCVIADFKSLYPSIIITFNLSPETIVENGSGEFKVFNKLEKDGFTLVNHERLSYTNKFKGIFPTLLEELIGERSNIKDKMSESEKLHGRYSIEWKKYNAENMAIKTLMNAFYGQMGYINFRLLDLDVANTVTWLGRTIIKNIISNVKEEGKIKVLGSDTDSIFLGLDKNLTPDELIKVAQEYEDLFNKITHEKVYELYPECNSYKLKINIERIFHTMIFPDAKKRYAGLTMVVDGKPIVEVYTHGFELIRKDIPKPCKKILKWGFQKLLEGDSIENVKTGARKMFIEEKNKNSLYNMGFTKTITRDLDSYKVSQQHVRAAKYSNQFLGTSFARMGVPSILFCKNVPHGKPHTDVLAVSIDMNEDLLNGFEWDWNLYYQKYIYNHLKKAFEIIDSSYEKDIAFDQVHISNFFKK